MVVAAGRARHSSRPHGGNGTAASAAAGLTSQAETLLRNMLAVQRELPPEQAVVIAARTGCTAEAVLDFWQRRLEARARCLREARERAAASAAAAAAEGKPAFVIPATDAEMHALIASAAAAREAATAKLRALQDAAGKGLRDASVTGQLVSLMASLTTSIVRCSACDTITGSSRLVRRKLVAAAGFLTTLEEWLEAAVTARHISLFLAALTALQSLPLEAPLLRSSGCAGLLRMVRQLAKHPRKEVAAAAGELASQWQAVLQGGSAGLPTSSGQPAVKQEAEQQQQQTQQWWQQPEPLQQQQTQQAQQPEPLQRAHQQEQEQQTQTQRQTQPQTQQAQQAQRKRSRQEQHPQQHEGLQQPQQQPPANDPPGSKGPAACGPVSTDAAVGAAAGKAGKVPAAAGSSASKEGQAAPDEDLALKERPLFKKIVRTLHAAKKGGSGGAATAAGSTVTAHTASTAGAAGTAGTAGGAATPAAASGHAARTPRPVPAGTAGGSSAPPASAPASAAAAAAGASSGAAAKSDTHSMPAPTKPTESCQAADVKAQPLGKAVSAGWPPSQQQQTAGSAKRPRAEGESSSGGSRRSGQPPFPKRRQQQQHQSAGSQAPQHAQQGAQQPQQQLQAQVQWQPPPAFDLPAADDPVAFGEDSTEVAAMAAARALGQQLPDAAGCPAVQEEQAAVPGLPYVPTDAQDAQEQEQALRKAGWQPAV